ncbi:MAG: cache domain-containing protein, partial [Halorientalis sp.]
MNPYARIQRSYGLKLIVGFLIVLVAIGAIGGYMYTTATRELNHDAERKLETRAQEHASTLDTWLNSSEASAELVSQSAATQAQTGNLDQYLHELVANGELTTGARAVHYVNTSTSEIVASSLDQRVGENPRTEGAPWAQQDLTGMGADEVLVSVFQPSVANTTVVTFVSPVVGANDRAVVYVADLTDLSTILRQSSDTAYTRVVDSNGQIVLSQHNSSEIGQQYRSDSQGVDTAAVSQSLNGTAGYTRLSADQTPAGEGERVVGYAPAKSGGLAVIVHDDPKSVFTIKRHISTGLLGVLAVAIVGLVAIGLTIGRSTLDSIDTLAAKARQMEDGDLDVSVETTR